MKVAEMRADLRRHANAEKAAVLQRFFKTGPGEYGEGDVFLGVAVPQTRRVARKYRDAPLSEVRRLLRSRIHEERLLALLILVLQFQRGDEAARKRLYELYLSHTRFINNWDLVDASAERILGGYLVHQPKQPLSRLARSENPWERRMAIMATFHFSKGGRFTETLRIAGLLLNDEEDLIHKAVGWMLREVGKRNSSAQEAFLKKRYNRMPRTMLRYAIERFPERKRQAYLKGKI